MLFRHPAQRYGQTPDAETPYARAGREWDDRLGSARAQSANWRLMAFGSLLLAGGLAAATVWQAGQSRVEPYVVEVDALGEARAVAPAIQHYQPTDGQIAWHLGRFIVNVRSVSTDPVLVRRAWLDAYEFADDKAARFLNEYARANDPFANIGRRSVSVQVNSVVRASESSFQVKWSESVFEDGSFAGSTRWTAILSVATRPPRTSDALRRNPLGLFVTAIDWTQEIDAAPRPAANPRRPAPPAQGGLP